MQILENQHQWSRLRDDLERFAQFANHPLASRPNDLAVQCGVLIRPYQSRKLNQPGRSVGGQRLDHERPGWPTGKLSKRFEQWIVGFLATKALDRLSTCQRHSAD